MNVVRGWRVLIARSLLVVWCTGMPSSTAARDSRATLIARAQGEKAEHLGLEGPSRTERTIERIERSAFLGRTDGVYPWMPSIHPGIGITLGVGYVRHWNSQAHLDLGAASSFNGSTLLQAEAEMPEVHGGLLVVALDVRHAIAKELSFYGLGSGSTRANPLEYDYRPTVFGVTASLHPAEWFRASGRFERQLISTMDRAPGASVESPGLGDDLEYSVVHASAIVDWRTPPGSGAHGGSHGRSGASVLRSIADHDWRGSPGYSTRGGSHRVTWSRYFETAHRPFEFHQVEYEGIQLVPMVSDQIVLAGRVLTTLTTAERRSEIPFVLAPTLGGSEDLRGFATRRFTDRNRLLLSGEYRWRPSRWIDLALFVDAGKVGARREDLGIAHLETDWGLGARFHGTTVAGVRADVAKSREGWAVHLAGGKGF